MLILRICVSTLPLFFKFPADISSSVVLATANVICVTLKMPYVKKLHKTARSLFLLTIFLSNATNVNLQANLRESETDGFQCYQCVSNSREYKPLCDTSYFKLTRPEERWYMLVQCPRDRSDYCMKKVVIATDYVNTSRGCSNFYDSLGYRLEVGCIAMQNNEDVTLCYCDKTRCNVGEKVAQNLIYIVISTVFTCWINNKVV